MERARCRRGGVFYNRTRSNRSGPTSEPTSIDEGDLTRRASHLAFLVQAAPDDRDRPLLFADLQNTLPCRLTRLACRERQLLDTAPRPNRRIVQNREAPDRDMSIRACVFTGRARAR